jgi:capsular exopolysaccharide synthesis family protein
MTTSDIWRFYRALIRRRWVFAAVAGTALAVVSLGCLLLPRYYRASALVMPSDEALSQPAVSPSGSLERREATQDIRASKLADLINLAESETVINRVRQELGIGEQPQRLLRRVAIENLPGTSIIRVAVMDREPRQAVSMARVMASSFVEFYQELSRREAAATRKFLEAQLAESEKTLHAAEAALAAFYRTGKSEAPARQSETAPATPSTVEAERDTVAGTLSAAQARLAKRRAQLGSVPPVLVREERATDASVVSQMRTELAGLESQLASERAVHTDEHPNVVRLKASISDLRKRLAAEGARLVPRRTETPNPAYEALISEIANLEAEKVALSARLGALSAVSEQERNRTRLAHVGAVELAAPLRAQRVAEEAYTRMKAAADQARIDEQVTTQTGSIRIVDLPRAAQGPLTKGAALWQVLLAGAVLSIALGAAAAIGVDLLDDRLRSRADVQRVLQLPVTAVIPLMEDQPVALPAITSLAPVSPYAEAYRFLRTDVMFTARDRMAQTIMVATPKPGQGGTTTICNLAIAMAEADQRVILVDADLRRPSLHKVFSVPNDVGLSTILSNGAEIGQAMQRTHVENLLLLPAGPLPNNPSRLITSKRMREVVQALRQHSDFVLFDTPSALAFSDAIVLSSIVDGVLLVVRAQESPRGSELELKTLLEKAKANVIGVVLNAAPPADVDSVYYYGRYYEHRPLESGEQPQGLPAPADVDPEALPQQGDGEEEC